MTDTAQIVSVGFRPQILPDMIAKIGFSQQSQQSSARSGYFRQWLIEETQKHLDEKRRREEEKVEQAKPTKPVNVIAKTKPAPKKIQAKKAIKKKEVIAPSYQSATIIPLKQSALPTIAEIVSHYTQVENIIYLRFDRLSEVKQAVTEKRKRKSLKLKLAVLLLAA